MHGDDVDRELRNEWKRSDGGRYLLRLGEANLPD